MSSINWTLPNTFNYQGRNVKYGVRGDGSH